MSETLKNRLKMWICKYFGHRSEYSHDFNKQHHYICKRCRILHSKEIRGDEE